MKHFKGYEKKTGRRVFIEIYDKSKRPLYREKEAIGDVQHMDETGRVHLFDQKDLEQFYGIREISDDEYEIYFCCQHIIEECAMAGITGGFPDPSITKMARILKQDVDRFVNDVPERRQKHDGSI